MAIENPDETSDAGLFADHADGVDPRATVVTRQTPEQRALGITEVEELPPDAVDAPIEVRAELGESVEVIVDGHRIEAFLSSNVFLLDPSSADARFALRAYAYCLARRGQVDEAKSLLRQFGREG